VYELRRGVPGSRPGQSMWYCGGHSGTGTSFSPSSSVFPWKYHSTVVFNTHISSGGWTICPLAVAVQRCGLTPLQLINELRLRTRKTSAYLNIRVWWNIVLHPPIACWLLVICFQSRQSSKVKSTCQMIPTSSSAWIRSLAAKLQSPFLKRFDYLAHSSTSTRPITPFALASLFPQNRL
jgi:hypothetical protein